MIPNHTEFIAALHNRKQVRVRYFSKPDDGVVDRVCAPLDYGSSTEFPDGLNRYWLWDYSAPDGARHMGLVPKQIVDLRVLGEVFDPVSLGLGERAWCTPRAWSVPAAGTGSPVGTP